MAGAQSRVVWHGGKVRQELQQEMERRLRLVGERLASKIRRNLSTPGPAHSVPGEFPHAQSGNLRKSVTYDHLPRENAVQVGTTTEYASYLEHNLDRSFIERTFNEELGMVKDILTAPMKNRAGGGSISVESMDPGGDE